jgi:hypothetical protein
VNFEWLPSPSSAGAYPDEDQAAKAHDLAALKYWGPGVYTNFPVCNFYFSILLSERPIWGDGYIEIAAGNGT